MDSRLRGNDGYRKWRNFLPPSLLLVILANEGIYLKREDVFESIKPTKNVRSALAEAWIPASAGMTDIESSEISYRPWLLLVILANAGTHFKARGCFESIKPAESVGSALAEAWIPACARMTDIESNEISYRPWLLFVILANAVTHLKREDILSRLNRRKACAQRLLRHGFPPARE